MKTVILCGGQGTRLREHTEVTPKPMVEIGGMPILWHIMKTYANHGYKDFVLCLGYKGDMIKNYFYHYEMLSNDFTIELGSKNIEIHPRHDEHGWKVTLVDTGEHAMTGARVKRVEKYIDGEEFLLTYGDGVTDLNIAKEVEFHKSHGKLATVAGVNPPSCYGELNIENNEVVSFQEKPEDGSTSISGGYFVLNRKIFDYLDDCDDCVFEHTALEKLSNEKQLQVFQHKGFWQCMDTFRDYKYLSSLWDSGNAPWKVWE
jgi:glucose-1-phosphate cytidylyltransferase